VRLVHLDVDQKTFTIDPKAVEKAITSNTIGLVCSAPNFPQGTVDPVEEIAALGKKRGIPVHVDCCLGSFLIPFANEVYSTNKDIVSTGARRPIKPFDFRVDGVTSISTDTHKYGFAPKGSSVVMYSSDVFRHAQYFVAPEWTGGIYASPSIAGSRPGALIAACWATMVHVGKDGYRKAAHKILSAAAKVSQGIKERIPELRLLGEPDLSVVCFAPSTSSLNIYNVGDEMKTKGWNLNVLQNPPSIHLCVTYANSDLAATNFVDDLASSVKEVLSAPAGKYKNGSGAIYGMASSIPDKSLVNQVAYGFLDTLYKA
jgi:sphinganine-1-phosphate aldolase